MNSEEPGISGLVCEIRESQGRSQNGAVIRRRPERKRRPWLDQPAGLSGAIAVAGQEPPRTTGPRIRVAEPGLVGKRKQMGCCSYSRARKQTNINCIIGHK